MITRRQAKVMLKKRFLVLGCAFVAGMTCAQDAGSDIRRAGTIDELDLGANRIVIDDMEFQVSESLVVRATNGSTASTARLRTGISVEYRQAGERLIVELWLLPITYAARR
jgi:hypothetical protein